jgi:limonene-1,2-epoxide hydrolase
MARTPLEIVTQFLEDWNAGPQRLEESLRAVFRPDTEWVNVGMSRSVGPDDALKLGDAFQAKLGYANIGVDVLHAAANGDVVLTERIDRLLDAHGKEISRFAIMGVFELEDGKIVRWRDYTDPSAVPGLLAVTGH